MRRKAHGLSAEQAHPNYKFGDGGRAVGWRGSELAAFGPEVLPLDHADAATAYERAMTLCSRTRYGLDERTFAAIERLEVEEPGPDAQQWLADRVGVGDVMLVFDRDDVFRVPAPLFIGRWRDMFCPSRDDVVIVPVGGGWVLFYCHEDEFEFARV
jgi:hypothetical protein